MTDEQQLNYLRRKTADESELWAADRIEQLEHQRDELLAALRRIVAVCEFSMKTHGYDKAHAKNRVPRPKLKQCSTPSRQHGRSRNEN